MKERPIIFSSEMVRAILETRKTMTRRLVKPQPDNDGRVDTKNGMAYVRGERGDQCVRVPCPYGIPGDLLWIKETWASCSCGAIDCKGVVFKDHLGAWNVEKWKSPRFMPKKYSRITLEIINVRVEKLQEITEEDAKREGIEVMQRPESVGGGIRYSAPACGDRPPYWEYSAVTAFIYLWDSIYGKDSWEANPFVWVIEFKRVKP